MRNCVVLTVTDEHGARPGHSRSPMRCLRDKTTGRLPSYDTWIYERRCYD